jgi:hypothetical protein
VEAKGRVGGCRAGQMMSWFCRLPSPVYRVLEVQPSASSLEQNHILRGEEEEEDGAWGKGNAGIGEQEPKKSCTSHCRGWPPSSGSSSGPCTSYKPISSPLPGPTLPISALTHPSARPHAAP